MMADRVKYFVLGLLFLIVAGVIAYDRWNPGSDAVADSGDGDGWEISVGPRQPLQVAPEQEPATGTRGAGTSPTEGPLPPHLTNERRSIALDPLPPPSNPQSKPQPRREPDPLPLPQPKPLPKPAVKKTVHVIRHGETLESIALRYYKSRKGIAWIVEANGLANPNRIYENQKLIIPARKELTRKVPKVRTPAQPKTIPSQYTVKKGDGDLYAICRRFYGRHGEGARVAQVMELNQLWSADVKTGTVLRLPPK